MKKSFKVMLLSLAAMFFVVSAYAQVTTASLAGKVTDASGEAIPGATVVAVHTPSGSQYYGLTNSEGRYAINGMRSGGPYSVEVSCMGYHKVNYTDVTLQLAEVYALDAALKDDAELLQEAIVISQATSKFSQEKTGASTNVSNDDILALPSASRNISDIAKLSPYGGNGMSFGGGDGRSTNFTIDGANFNNNFGLSEALPGGGMPISMDAIEEVQIVVSPYDVRQSNFIGGGVNAIIKSGTNTIKGTAYAYYQNADILRGKTVAGQEASGTYSDKTVYGVTIGGPIIKNKLFFFLSGEYSGNEREIAYASWRPSEDGVAVPEKSISRTTVADMQRVSDYLKDTYGYDTGGWTNYMRPFSNLKLLGRIDWNINQDHHLAVRYNYTKNQSWTGTNGNSADFNSKTDDGSASLNGTRLSLNRLSEYSMAFANSCYSTENNVWSVSVDLNSRLGNNVSNQFLATYSNIEDVRGSDSSKFPFIDIMAGYEVLGDGKIKQTLEPYMAAGYELFTWYNGVHNRVLNVKDDVTAYLGSHKLTAGVSYEYQFADNSYIREGTGYYRFRSIDDFLNGEAPETVAISYGYGGNETPSARIQFSQVGVYAQDDWAVTNNFKVIAGVRFDTILYDENDIMTNNAIKALDYNGTHIDTGRWPTTNVQISPRVGFTWDVFGNKTLKVRGGTGLFAGRLPLVYMTNMPTNAAMFMNAKQAITTKYSNGIVVDRNSGLDAFAAKNNGGKLITDTNEIVKKLNELYPNRFPLDIKPEDGQLSATVNAVDPNFKMPQVWKSSLAFDFQVPVTFPWTITAEGIFNKTINGTLIKNWNFTDNTEWSQYTGSDNRHIYPTAANANYTSTPAYVLTNTDKGYGWIANVNTHIEPVKNLKLMFSYTHTVQKELTGMPGNDAESVFQGLPTVEGPNFTVLQSSRYVNPDRLMASISYKAPWRTNISIFYEGYVPTGLSYKFKGDFNGDSVQQDLIYIPKDENDILFASDADKANFMAFVKQDSYLSSHMGQYAGAYDVHAPMVHRFDLRISQDIRFRIGSTTQTFQLNADLMNFTNLMNDSWGVSRTFDDSAKSGEILSLDHVNANGQPVFKSNVGEGATTWRLNTDRGQCWYVQLGIKYMFN